MPDENGEHCQFLWRREVDPNSHIFLPSQWSDKIGFCYDHSKYKYDTGSDGVPDQEVPACATLQDGFGTGSDPTMPTTYFGAATLGCVDSTRLMMANGKVGIPDSAWEKLNKVEMPRPLYDESAYEALTKP